MAAAVQCSGHTPFRQLGPRTLHGTPPRLVQAAIPRLHAALQSLRFCQSAARPPRLAVKVAAASHGAADSVQQVVRLAQEEAISLGHSSCEPAHLLLGVLKEAGPAASILIRVGVVLAEARTAVETSVDGKQKKQAFMDVSDNANAELPLSTEAENALNIAREVAQASGEQCSAVHLLGGLLATQEVVSLLNYPLDVYPEVVLAQLLVEMKKSAREEAEVQDLVQCYSDALANSAEASLTDSPTDILEKRAASKEWQELPKAGSNYWEDSSYWSAGGALEFFRKNGSQRFSQPSDRLTPLHLAAQGGDVMAVRTLLTAGGYDVNAKGPLDDTPLHFAVRRGNLDVIEALLQAGADINAVNSSGGTSLHSAGKHDRDSCVWPLVAAGSNIEAQDINGLTPLGVAAADGHLGVMKALLDFGADPDGGRWGGIAPLFFAVVRDRASAVQALLNAGADPESWAVQGDSALLQTAYSGNMDIGKALLKAGANTEAKSSGTRMTSLHTAAARGHKDFVRLLLAAGARVEAKDLDGRTPLHAAAQEGRVETIKELLAAGSDIHARNRNGRTPLEWARFHSQLGAVEVLQSAAGKQQDPSASSLQPLQLKASESMDKEAAGPGSPAIGGSRSSSGRPDLKAMWLLEVGAKRGMWSGDTVRKLAKMGANVPMVNYNYAQVFGGPSFLHIAAEQGKTDVIRALVECGVHPSLPTVTDLRVPAIHYACIKSDHAEVVETLLELGASADERDAAGYTTLAAAAQAGSMQCVKAILAHGAGVDVNAASHDGTTALHIAALLRFTHVLDLLVAAGADLGAQDEDGNTALHYAVMNKDVQATATLVEAGAPLHAANAAGMTALGEARRMGNGALVTLLQQRSS